MEIVFQCEINKFCQSVLRAHWPSVPLKEDILALDKDDIPHSDLWCGGFPCQDLSLANQGKRKGLSGERSGLFYKFAELVSEKKPRWLVIENVPGLLNSHSGKDFKIVLQSLDELGYGISWRILDAKYFGTPQRRRRVYVVGSLGDLSSAKILFEQGSTQIISQAGIGEKAALGPSFTKGNGDSDLFSVQHATIGRKHTAGPQAKGYRNDGETYTLDSRGSADVVCSTIDPFRMRDTSRISKALDGNRYRAIGNAVQVNVVEWIGKRIALLENS